jgi:pimeloyl-ACP methyl ester carboxylesterase
MSATAVESLAGEQIAAANGIEIAYEEFGDPDGEPLLLIMGLATQMIHWDERFCAMLGERGYRVIRFDNRDIGHSTMIDAAGTPPSAAMMFGYGKPAYLLGDMAADTAGLLDNLEIDSAHVVGASMGGMIAQQLAIDHPDRVRSLCSIMSTTGNRRFRFPRWRAFALLMAKPARSREGYVEQAVKTFKVIGSPAYPMDEERFRELVGRAYDRSFHPPGVARQLHAINCSGNRTKRLRRLHLPALVIHGTADPLVRPIGGRETARAIPGARLRMIEGMGHDLPPELHHIYTDEIDSNARRAASQTAAAR